MPRRGDKPVVWSQTMPSIMSAFAPSVCRAVQARHAVIDLAFLQSHTSVETKLPGGR